MHSRTRATRVLLRFAALAFLACSLEPRLPFVTQLAAYRCGNGDCTQLGVQLTGLPPQSGLFMVGAWFRGTHDVHWSIRWPGDSVQADFTALRDSSIVAVRLDGMPLQTVLVLAVTLLGGRRDTLAWDYR